MRLLFLFMLIGMALPVMVNAASSYPGQSIKVIVPNGAGGSTDRLSRLMVNELNTAFDVGVAVINIPGGGTSKGAQQVARSKADGYTLLSTHEALLTSSALKINRLGIASLTPVAQLGSETYLIAVPKDSPITDLASFYAAAKDGIQGKRIKIGVNPGAANHFFLMQALAPVDENLVIVPTGDGAKNIKSVLGGHLDAGIFAISEVKHLIDAGQMKGVVIFDKNRSALLPNLATAIEQGHDIIIQLNYIVWAPANTPEAIINILQSKLKYMITTENFLMQLQQNSILPDYLDGPALKSKIQSRFALMQSIASDIKAKAQKDNAP